MKAGLVFLILFGVTLFGEIPKIPKWFIERTYQPSKSYEIIGYGMGDSLKEAMLRSKEDIAGQLMTEISSSKKSRLYEKDGELSSSMDIKIDAQIHTVLSDTKPLRMETVGDQYFVAMLYENLKLSQRFIKKAGKIECIGHAPNPYLALTPMYKEIKKEAGCDIDFSLVRKDKVWYIAYKSTLVPIAPVDYEDLFISSKQSPIMLSASNWMLKEGDEFYFSLSSSENGYVTLLIVYANGITAIVEPSMKIEKGKQVRIPPEESETYFEAGLLNKGQPTHDLYIAIFSQKPIDVSRFEMSADKVVKGESNFKADELIRMLSRYPFTTLFIRTKPKG